MMPLADQALPIEDYAVIGDCNTTALVGRNGSIDWLCWPRFDSAACFAALLGTSDHGRWLIGPAGDDVHISRAYRDGGLVLETVFTTPGGTAVLIDFMVPEDANSTLVRIVEGRTGEVSMIVDLALRFDYGQSVPWATRLGDSKAWVAIVGPELVVLRADVELEGRDLRSGADFTVSSGERVAFVMRHGPSHLHRRLNWM